MVVGITFIILAFPGFGQPPQVWSRLTQPPYPYLQPNNQCDNFFVKKNKNLSLRSGQFLGRMWLWMSNFFPSIFPTPQKCRRWRNLLSVVIFSNHNSRSIITNRKHQTQQYCTDKGDNGCFLLELTRFINRPLVCCVTAATAKKK